MAKKKSPKKRKIALIAHDNKKEELVDWARRHLKSLVKYPLVATGTTGSLLRKRLGVKIKLCKWTLGRRPTDRSDDRGRRRGTRHLFL